MNSTEKIFQGMVYASCEASLLNFADRLSKREGQNPFIKFGKAVAGNVARPITGIPDVIGDEGDNFYLMNSGLANMVYFGPLDVVKVNVRTLRKDRRGVELQRVKNLSDYLQMDTYLHDYLLPTRFKVGEFMGRHAVFSRQPRIHPEKMFESVDDLVAYRDDSSYREMLGKFFKHCKSFHDSTGFYPDLLGKNNLALVFDKTNGERLILVDSDPVSPEIQLKKSPNSIINIGGQLSGKLAVIGSVCVQQSNQLSK